MFKTVAVGGDVITLLLQGILQDRVTFQAFALLVYLCIQQSLLSQQQTLLGRTQRLLARRGAIQAVTDLLQLLRSGVHRILHTFRLGL